MRALFSACVAVVFGLYAPLAFCAGEGAPAIEVDLCFALGPSDVPAPNGTAGTYTASLNEEGSVVFTDANPLLPSDWYVGYSIKVTKRAGSGQFTSNAFHVQIYYNHFEGFWELEPGKFSPILTMVAATASLQMMDGWQEVSLRNPNNGQPLAVAYLRLRTTTDTTASEPKSGLKLVKPEAPPQAAK